MLLLLLLLLLLLRTCDVSYPAFDASRRRCVTQPWEGVQRVYGCPSLVSGAAS